MSRMSFDCKKRIIFLNLILNNFVCHWFNNGGPVSQFMKLDVINLRYGVCPKTTNFKSTSCVKKFSFSFFFFIFKLLWSGRKKARISLRSEYWEIMTYYFYDLEPKCLRSMAIHRCSHFNRDWWIFSVAGWKGANGFLEPCLAGALPLRPPNRLTLFKTKSLFAAL